MSELKLQSPLQYVKGVGPKKAAVLAEFGLETVADILGYYPRHYLDRTTITPIAEIKPDRPVTVVGEVKAHGILHGGKRRYEVILQDQSGAVSLLWFGGIKYWERTFKKGQVFAATGTVSYFQGYQIVHPEMERLEDESDKMVHAGRIIPVYPQRAELNKVGLNSRGIRRITTYILENLRERWPDPLPDSDRVRLGLLDRHRALCGIHYPEDREEVESCRRRLAFDELLVYQFLVLSNKNRRQLQLKAAVCDSPGKKVADFVEALPFELTDDQKEAVAKIHSDQAGQRPMTRMLQGDVGCGKTVVAVLAAVLAAENGLQTAFMAPTEILAEQHFRTWREALEHHGITTGLLTSSTRKAAREEVAAGVSKGDIDVLFGTHALIYDYVSFDRLGLAVIDEQHRFGVEQRSRLHAKGENPDLLVMTATPIPRTLALTLYGDLDITTIRSLPPGRKPIRTVWRTSDISPRIQAWVRDEVRKGGQAYIIYPLIERSEQSDLKSIEDAYAELTAGVLADVRVGMVHGRMKTGPKDKVLEAFRSGELDVLMATTVVEVGIDNPNATIMVIEHAERFGLAQLHQLRGRVGRGTRQSTLVAVAHEPLSDLARRRLDYLAGTTDGFEIAEADLELRGPGELYGVRQSGLPAFKVADLGRDRDLIGVARELLAGLLATDNRLDSEHDRLYRSLQMEAGRWRPMVEGG